MESMVYMRLSIKKNYTTACYNPMDLIMLTTLKWKGNKITLDFDKKSLISETFIEKTATFLDYVDKTNRLNAFVMKESLQPAVEKIKLGFWWRSPNGIALNVIPFMGKTTKKGDKFYSNFEEKENAIVPGIDNGETVAIQNEISKLNFVNQEFGFDSHYYYQYRRVPVVEDLFDILKDEMNGYFNDDYPKSFKNYVPVQLSNKRVDLKIIVLQKDDLYEMYAEPSINGEPCKFDDLDTTNHDFSIFCL